MFFEWLLSLMPAFHGDVRVLAVFIYLAMGAFVLLHAQGAAKYYHRQWKNDDQPVVNFLSLLLCILLWPVLVSRRDVHLPMRLK